MNTDIQNIFSNIDLSRLGLSLSCLFAAFIVIRVLKWSSGKFSKSFPDLRLRADQFTSFGAFFISLMTFALAIFLLFRSKEAALAIGGSLSLAFAFGAKDLAASFLSGMIIVLDRSFQVGDRVLFDGKYGDILSIGLRSTKLRTLDDSLVNIPNNLFMSNAVSSANSGALDMLVEVSFYIDPNTSLELIEKLIREAAVSSRYTFLEKDIVILFKDEIHHNKVFTQAKLKAYVIETRYEKLFETDIVKRCHKAFLKNKILFQ